MDFNSPREAVEAKLQKLRDSSEDGLTADEVIQLSQSIIATLEQKHGTGDGAVVENLKEVAAFIQRMRQDFSVSQPDGLKASELPAAHDELDAVVAATEKATNEILGATEEIQKIAKELPDEQRKQIMEQATLIFEASNFQDITGQRITKVVSTLKKVEDHITQMLKSLGYTQEDLQKAMAQEEKKPVMTEEDLLNGPQLPEGGDGNRQDEIDAILASFD